jgi:thioredoxin-related protein
MISMSKCVVAAALAAVAAVGQQEWSTDYAAAVKKAKAENKVVLADFTGSDWCGWCVKLKKEVFDTPEFKEWAEKKAVLVELDFPKKKKLDEALTKQNKELQGRFGVKGFPTILFVDGDDKELGRTGYVKGGPAEWIKKAEEAMKPKAAAAEGQGDWLEDLDAAIAKAKKEKKKIILADFTGSDWCGWCIKLKEEVFSKKEFAEWAKKNVVLLELDFPRKKEQSEELKKKNAALRDKFEIKGYPTILFLDLDGKKVGQTGYVKGGPEAWIKEAEKAMKK